MAIGETRVGDLPAERPALLQALRVVAPLLTLMVLVQAALIGQGLYRPDTDLVRLHGYVGNASWLVAVVQAGLALLAGLRGRLRPILIGTTVLLAILMTAQIGLGYSGRDGGQPAAWHLTNGVLVFGLTIATMIYVALARRGEDMV